MSMNFGGRLVYLEFNAGRVFEVVTRTGGYLTSYDVDWCDSHGHLHAHASGGASLPMRVGPRFGEDKVPVPTQFWAAPEIALEVQEPCVRLTAAQLLALLIEDEGYRQEWLEVEGRPTVEAVRESDAPSMFAYWSKWGEVEEGEVIYCGICRMNHDYEQERPCPHVAWCHRCGLFSTPPHAYDEGECPHRSPDGDRYIDPDEPDAEDVEELWQAFSALTFADRAGEPEGVLTAGFFDWRAGTPRREAAAWFGEHAPGGLEALVAGLEQRS
jgi:hypothetical protein